MSNIPTSSLPIQQEAAETGSPTSESLFFSIGGAINYLLNNRSSVGDIVTSFLDETTFQAQHDLTWVLCDGRDVTGSDFNTLTGLTNVPDMRGCFARAKDNGRGLDPHGDLPIGTFEADQFASHTHTHTQNALGTNGTLDVSQGSDKFNADPGLFFLNINATGGSETNPKAVIINYFTKINV